MNSTLVAEPGDLAPYGHLTAESARAAFDAAAGGAANVLDIARKILADSRNADVCFEESEGTERWILNVRVDGGRASPEQHRDWHDLSLYLLGGNDLRVEGSLTEAEEVSDGEWRKGALVGGTVFPIRAGDLFWTPASVPHQSDFLPQTAFLIVKMHRNAPATIGALDRIANRERPQHIPSFVSFC